MPPRLFVTGDTVASIHKAHADFTHVMVNRASVNKVVPLQSGKIDARPVYVFASWEPASFAQLDTWRQTGGVLFARDSVPDKAGPTDVLVFVQCPFTMEGVRRAISAAREYVVIPRPHTWKMHTETVELRMPPVETLREIWKHCRGRRMTDLELADATGIPEHRLQYIRGRFKPANELEMRPQLAPENPALLPAWDWINVGNGAGRSASRKQIRLAGHKAAIQEMVRLGHIALTTYQHYQDVEPRWDLLERRRATALAELAAVRALVESIPDHLAA